MRSHAGVLKLKKRISVVAWCQEGKASSGFGGLQHQVMKPKTKILLSVDVICTLQMSGHRLETTFIFVLITNSSEEH